MAGDFLPGADSLLLAWGLNFSTRVSAAPLPLGLSVADATDFAAKFAAFQTAMAAVDPGTRSKSFVSVKNVARDAMKSQARILAKKVEADVNVTDAQKIDLNLNVRSAPSPIPVPAEEPVLEIVSVTGRTVTAKAHSPTSVGRAKPPGCAYVYVFSYVGTTAPTDPSVFKFQGSSPVTTFKVVFPPSVPGGSQIWLSACWVNPRAQTGPCCSAIPAFLQGSASAAA